jgi:hypothetical protein
MEHCIFILLSVALVSILGAFLAVCVEARVILGRFSMFLAGASASGHRRRPTFHQAVNDENQLSLS